jgi:2-polyprenyl-3-methyl-5-hydroxy-6-metoxy-1,4-benzoquinol methylase
MEKQDNFIPKATMEAFDSFWEAPENIEKGYYTFGRFYKYNYLKYFPENKNARILTISCGPGYLVDLLNKKGYNNVIGIDSIEEKIKPAITKKLNCIGVNSYDYLNENKEPFDVIFCEQEINHLTKDEIILYMKLFRENLNKGGRLIVHSLNGANPIVGSENLALNFDHFNTFTENSLKDIMKYSQFSKIKVFPLKLYVFYKNPLNYIGIIINAILNIIFRSLFIFYGKKNKIFSKKIAAVGFK